MHKPTATPSRNMTPTSVVACTRGGLTLSCRYRPELAGLSGTTLLIRNNLTIVEKMTVAGEGGRG